VLPVDPDPPSHQAPQHAVPLDHRLAEAIAPKLVSNHQGLHPVVLGEPQDHRRRRVPLAPEVDVQSLCFPQVGLLVPGR
jgi:hypothetical protein